MAALARAQGKSPNVLLELFRPGTSRLQPHPPPAAYSGVDRLHPALSSAKRMAASLFGYGVYASSQNRTEDPGGFSQPSL
jgi:hypothetical protein